VITLEVNHLGKNYGPIRALDDFSIQIETGQVFGLLGPNGSGKTTFLGIITGILAPTSGSFRWFENKWSVPNLQIGALLETPNFYPYLNADQNLDIVRQIKGVPSGKFDELLELVKLKERRHSKFSTYSLGMKQRLAIASTMVGDPEVLIFDEPTNGLDPEGIAEVRNILIDIASTGRTVIMASHILNEVEKICSHVAIIKRGELLASGPVGMILGNHDLWELSSLEMEKLIQWSKGQTFSKGVRIKAGLLELEIEPEVSTETVVKSIHSDGILLSHIVRKKRSLEEEFLQITNNTIRS